MWILQGPVKDEGNDEDADAWTFRLLPGAIKTVGRAQGADLIVDAALVSRVHCRLEASGDRLEVIDLSSTNGTYVNGSRISRANLAAGDLLRVGRVELKVARSGG